MNNSFPFVQQHMEVKHLLHHHNQQVKFDLYQFDIKLGSGAFGCVYKATNKKTGLIRAIKLISKKRVQNKNEEDSAEQKPEFNDEHDDKHVACPITTSKKTMSKEEAENLLRSDIQEFELSVIEYIENSNVQLSQNQFDALVSLA